MRVVFYLVCMSFGVAHCRSSKAVSTPPPLAQSSVEEQKMDNELYNSSRDFVLRYREVRMPSKQYEVVRVRDKKVVKSGVFVGEIFWSDVYVLCFQKHVGIQRKDYTPEPKKIYFNVLDAHEK